MMRRRLLSALLASTIATSCHDTTSASSEQSRLLAASGSTFPVVRQGDTLVLEGSGFGASQGNGLVLFGTSSATVAASVVSWSDNQLIVTVPSGVSGGSIVVSPDTGAALGPIPVIVNAAASFSPASFTWTAGPGLPTGLRAVQLTALTYPSDTGITARLHATGGVDTSAIQPTSLFALADAAGPAAWAPASASLPTTYLYSATAAATQARARLRRHSNRDSTVEGVSYLIGGIDGAGRVSSDVNGMSVWENGDEGAWTRLVPLPDPRAGSAAVVAYGNLYVVGGFGPDSVALSSTSVAVVDSFGAPTGWIAGPPLPEGRAFSAVIIHNHTMYVIGGETGHLDPSAPDSAALRPDVFTIRLSSRSGFFLDTGWQTLATPLLSPRTRHAAFDVDAGILVSVGVTAVGAAESEFAQYEADGGLGAFTAVPGPAIATLGGGSISEAGFASYTDGNGLPHVVIVGGVTASGGLSNRVWWH